MLDRPERVMRVIVLGAAGEPVLEQVRKVFKVTQTGTVVESLPATADPETTLKAMTALKARL